MWLRSRSRPLKTTKNQRFSGVFRGCYKGPKAKTGLSKSRKTKKITLHKKLSFTLRISSVNVTKSEGNSGFGHIC